MLLNLTLKCGSEKENNGKLERKKKICGSVYSYTNFADAIKLLVKIVMFYEP